MHIIRKLLLVILSIVLFTDCAHKEDHIECDPSQGYVPDSTTAVQLAQIFFVRVYGEKVLEKKPFIAVLKNGKIWMVDGTLEKGMDGGVPHIEIQKSDGKILAIYHGK